MNLYDFDEGYRKFDNFTVNYLFRLLPHPNLKHLHNDYLSNKKFILGKIEKHVAVYKVEVDLAEVRILLM